MEVPGGGESDAGETTGEAIGEIILDVFFSDFWKILEKDDFCCKAS